ncbi:MAG: LysR family transcriptional regulator [Aphanocapsa lilacina HA4352-LM1]|jgi:DNA-binding transcriptional LysR family regulator|nr:LysR family transcriptional regulator [Aphanocapsa lilacina HA4352-LM1]
MANPARDIEFRQLRYFVALAEELHFGQAASRLRIAQPSLSRQIQRLEQQIGSALFRRTRKQVQLTAVGQIFFEQAKRTIEQHERAVESARSAASQQVNVLTIGFEPCAAFHGLPKILQQFSAFHPDTRLVSDQLTAPQQKEALRRGQIDAGFLHPPVDEPDLVFEPVMEEAFLAALPATHPLARRRKVVLSELASEPFILFPREVAPACFDIIYQLCREAGFVPSVQHLTSDLNLCLTLVASGVGVTVAPDCARERRIGGVAYRPLSKATPRVESGFVRRPGSISPALELLLKLWRSYAGNCR